MLGNPTTTTTLSGGAFYGGSYRVLGDLVLTNGTYTLKPGTIFYVDGQASKTPQRQVTGAAIILGANASLVLDGVTITASGTLPSCPMWRGIVVQGNGRAPGSTKPRITIQNGSVVSHAWCGLGTDGHPTWDYFIDNSTFANNLTHVRDNAGHDGQTVSVITGSTFDSDPPKMHYPYEQTAAGDKYYTYEALYLTPMTSLAFGHTIEVRDNTINNAVYGIVNNQFDRGGVWIENNNLNKIILIGIWTVNNDMGYGRSGPTTSGNVIAMNNIPGLNTDQVDSGTTRYGILGEAGAWHYNSFVNNTVTGNNNMSYNQIGLSISGQTDARGNWIQQVNEGISATNLDHSELIDNLTGDCARGLVVKDKGNGMNQVYRLGCNTFARGSGLMSSTPVGITFEAGATINDIGSFSSPAANRFDGLTYALENNSSSSVAYYQTNSSQENVNVTGPGSSYVTLYTVFMRSKGLYSYCLNNGAPNGNGVNLARGATPSAGYVAALMDSVRQQLVPPARARGYLHEVLSYHASTKQLPALETWWATLAAPNAAAYRTAGLYLLNAYDAQRATADAQRIVLALQPAALLNAELAAQLQLRAVLRHVSQTTPRLVAADSAALRTLAWSGTGVADQAAYWLRYFHPRIALPVATPMAPLRPAAPATRKTVLAESGVLLGAAYPNPAQTEVTISCQLVREEQAAELRFINLLTGQVALVVPVAGTGTERKQRVALAGLPAGQYAYQLVVEGQLVAAPKRFTVNP